MSGKAAANTLIFRIDILLFATTRPKRAEPKKLVSGLLRELICHSLDRFVILSIALSAASPRSPPWSAYSIQNCAFATLSCQFFKFL